MAQKRVKPGTSRGGQFAPDVSGKAPAASGPVLPATKQSVSTEASIISASVGPTLFTAYQKLVPNPSIADILTQRIRSVLPECDELRKPAYRGNLIPSAGHCYIASELLYHALGGKEAGWTPQTLRHEDSPHWFLRHTDGTVLDPTADQFRTPVPYGEAKGIGFLTKQPSKRCQQLARLAGIALPEEN